MKREALTFLFGEVSLVLNDMADHEVFLETRLVEVSFLATETKDKKD